MMGVLGRLTAAAILGAGVSIVSGRQVSDRELDHFALLNELRAAGFTCPEGRHFAPNPTPLKFDCRLWSASQLHSQDMADLDYFSHTSQDGSGFVDRGLAQGIRPNAENLAAGRNSAQGVLDLLKSSDTHCRNMMNPAVKLFAAGYGFNAGATHRHYWTQMFANAQQAADVTCLFAPTTTITDIPTTTEVSATATDTRTSSTGVGDVSTTPETLATTTEISTTTDASEPATTTEALATTTEIVTTTVDDSSIATTSEALSAEFAQVQGSLVLSVSDAALFTEEGSPREIRAALAAAVADVAGVDSSAVRVIFGGSRRLQAGSAVLSTVTVEYTIAVPADEAAAVAERIVSRGIPSATSAVEQRLSDAGFDGVVEVVGLSAEVAATADGPGAFDSAVLAALVAAGYCMFNLAFFAYLCCSRASSGAGAPRTNGAAAERQDAHGPAWLQDSNAPAEPQEDREDRSAAEVLAAQRAQPAALPTLLSMEEGHHTSTKLQ